MPKIETFTPSGTMIPVGPYSHIAKVGRFITIGGTAGVDPMTGTLAGPDIEAQTKQTLDAFTVMLASVGSGLDYIIHINDRCFGPPQTRRITHNEPDGDDVCLA